MGDKTHVEWTDATWNVSTGCDRVSGGCRRCYAEREWKRLSANPATVYSGRSFNDLMVHPERLVQPLRWATPRRIFVNSMSDLFHDSVPDQFLDQVIAVMALSERHVYQVLTKRSMRMLAYVKSLPERTQSIRRAIESNGPHSAPKKHVDVVVSSALDRIQDGLPKNVHLGVSVEDQAAAEARLPHLIETPASVKWVSAEPMIGEQLHLVPFIHELDWVVLGGESGPKARPMSLQAARSVRDQCARYGVSFFFKQWGAWAPDSSHLSSSYPKAPTADFGGHAMRRVGKKASGRLLDGVMHDAYPAEGEFC